MKYELRKYDMTLATFKLDRNSDGVFSSEFNIIKENEKHLPIDLVLNDKGILSWLKGRSIPKNRMHADNFLSKLGLNIKDVIGLISISKGLSLNDSYWIVEEKSKDKFKDYNLYDNKLSKIASSITFTGYGSISSQKFISSPEFTTNGMLPKAWRNIKDKIVLYKGGSTGFSNSGYEPYSEFYASQIAQKMKLNHVPYNLSKWKKTLSSTCELFTSKDVSFLPAWKLVDKPKLSSIIEKYKELGNEFYKQLIEMFVFDAIIYNEDRHFGNFGVLIDNKTNKIVRPAPVFDNGLALFYLVPLDQIKELEEYAKTRRPKNYDDFLEGIKEHITPEIKTKVRKLINFRFKKHNSYNLKQNRLKKIEEVIQKRVLEIIK